MNDRPHHPQMRGVVERYNRTIKEIIKNLYIETNLKGSQFSLEKESQNSIALYDSTKNNIKGFAQN